MGLIKLEDFKPVDISDKPYLQDVFFKFELLPCEYVFTNLFIWRKIYDIRWMKFRNAVLIHSGLDKTLLMPIGNIFTPEELKDLLCSIFPDEEDASIIQVPEDYIKDNPKINDVLESELDDKFADYIYSTEKLYLLRGAKLAKKKNLLLTSKALASLLKANSSHFRSSVSRAATRQWFISKNTTRI
jgi:hypothetical protein